MNNSTDGGFRRKPHRIRAFLQNKIFILFFLPVIALIIIIAAVLIIRVIKTPEAEGMTAAGSEYIYVLPISERPADDTAAPDRDPFAGSGTAALVLDGIMYNPDGVSVVILRSTDASYLVSPDGLIGQTGWMVSAVTADTVTIVKNDKSEVLSLTAAAAEGLFGSETEGS